MVLEWTPEEASLLQDQAAASVYISSEACMGDSEPPDISSSSISLLTRGQETLYETFHLCLCHSH